MRVRVREIIKEESDEENEDFEEEEVHAKRLLDQIGKIRRTVNEREKIKKQLDGKRVSAQRRQSLLDGIAKYNERIINGLKNLQLNRKQTEAIADGLKRALERMQSMERQGQGLRAQARQVGQRDSQAGRGRRSAEKELAESSLRFLPHGP